MKRARAAVLGSWLFLAIPADEAIEWLLARTLSDRSYGARPLRRAIQRHVEDALSEAFIRGQIRGGQPIEVGVKDGGLWYQQGDRGGALSA